MSQSLASPPLQTPLVEPPMAGRPPSWLITRHWFDWFQSVITRVQTAAYAVSSAAVALEDQNAAIGLTSLVPISAAQLYRVTWRVRLSQAATTSSSLRVDIVTTDGGVTVTYSSTAYTGNAVSAPQSGSFLVRCDASVPLQYQTQYASVGATPMLYDLDIICEAL